MPNFNDEPCRYDVMFDFLVANGYTKSNKTNGDLEVWDNGKDYVTLPLTRESIPAFNVSEIVRKVGVKADDLQLYNPIVYRQSNI